MPTGIVTSGGYSIGKARLEGAVVSVIRDWATAHPDELMALDRKVKMMRDFEYGTPQEQGMHMAEIPVTLDRALRRYIHWNYLNDPELRAMVLDHFRVGCTNRNARRVHAE